MELMFQPLKKYATFTGRARRKEYWLFALLYAIAGITGVIIDGLLFDNLETGPVQALVVFGLLIPSAAVSFRRLHDIDRSAWWLLIGLIPLIGALVVLYFNIQPGTKGSNRFGPDPKESAGDVAAAFS